MASRSLNSPTASLVAERVPLPVMHNVLTQEWKRVFARIEDLQNNLDYLEARLIELLRPEEPTGRVVRVPPEIAASSPFTQRLGTVNDRLEEMVVKVENLQRRLDV